MINSMYFVPHGMQIIPGLDPAAPQEFAHFHQQMLRFKAQIASENPESILLFTPHGYLLENNFVLYNSEILRAYYPFLNRSNVDGTSIDSIMEFRTDRELIDEIWKKFSEKLPRKFGMDRISLGSENFPIPLGWGASVPLYYCQGETFKPNIVVISLPRARRNLRDFRISLQAFGDFIFEIVKGSSKRIGVIFSGDLAHTHQNSPNFSFHPSSRTFDDIIISWFRNLSREVALPEKLYPLETSALACGLSTLTILEGILKNIKQNDDNVKISSEILAYSHPTYFGMLLAHISIK